MNTNAKSGKGKGGNKAKSMQEVRALAADVEVVSAGTQAALKYADALQAYRADSATAASAKTCAKAAGIIRTFAEQIGARLVAGAALNRDTGLKVARIGAALATKQSYVSAVASLDAKARGSIDASVPAYLLGLLGAGDAGLSRKASALCVIESGRYKDASGAQMSYARQGLQALGIVSDASRNGTVRVIDRDAALALLPDGALESILQANDASIDAAIDAAGIA